jgi:hypothetical protein
LNNLLSARNGLITNWVSYETQRIDLFADLDIMNIDAQGVWTNDSRVPTFNGGPVPSCPDPLRSGPERLYPGPATRPDPIGAGAPSPLPPPPPETPSPFLRP